MAAPLESALYVVATPLGNLEDITLRAIRVLKEVSVIACEDTRQTQKLLNHFDIKTKLVSYHEHNELTRAAELITQLENGSLHSIAVVSDAGTPAISDPGYRLVALAIRHKVPVVPVPGPAAFVAALVASGLPTDAFRFSGFMPAKSGQRRSLLEEIAGSPRTQIFYEAPHRIVETLQDVLEVLGAMRRVCVAREVTKMHEEFLRGTASEVLEQIKSRPGEVRGEITLLIGKAEEARAEKAESAPSHAKRLKAIMAEQSLDEKAALKVLAKETGIAKSELYRELQRKRK